MHPKTFTKPLYKKSIRHRRTKFFSKIKPQISNNFFSIFTEKMMYFLTPYNIKFLDNVFLVKNHRNAVKNGTYTRYITRAVHFLNTQKRPLSFTISGRLKCERRLREICGHISYIKTYSKIYLFRVSVSRVFIRQLVLRDPPTTSQSQERNSYGTILRFLLLANNQARVGSGINYYMEIEKKEVF